MELKPQLQQKQTISPKMMQSVQILQMGMQELEAYITDIALENPLIELEGTIPQKSAETGEDALARKTEWLMATDSQNRVYYETDREEDGFYERAQGDPAKELESYLMVQLLSHCQTEREKQIFYYMVQSLDSRGYMDEELGGLAERFGLSETECEAYLSCLQSCDPAGIGARDLKECLLLQLERYPGSGELARRLVTEYLDWVGRHRFSQIAAKLGCSPELVQKAVKQIQKLNPIPGNGFSKRENLKYIYPDVIVVRFEGYYEILLNESQSHRMHINSYYVDILKDEQADAETKKYIKSKLEQVNWAVHCIEQRNATLHRVAAAIVTWQKLFFERGLGYLRPMSMADLAKELEIAVSTVSRAVKDKYLQCSYGIFPMSYFFSRSMRVEKGKAITLSDVKSELQRIIQEENKKKPYSDLKLAEQLAARGFPISRRTVAKYRAQLGLADAEGRRQFEG